MTVRVDTDHPKQGPQFPSLSTRESTWGLPLSGPHPQSEKDANPSGTPIRETGNCTHVEDEEVHSNVG